MHITCTLGLRQTLEGLLKVDGISVQEGGDTGAPWCLWGEQVWVANGDVSSPASLCRLRLPYLWQVRPIDRMFHRRELKRDELSVREELISWKHRDRIFKVELKISSGGFWIWFTRWIRRLIHGMRFGTRKLRWVIVVTE